MPLFDRCLFDELVWGTVDDKIRTVVLLPFAQRSFIASLCAAMADITNAHAQLRQKRSDRLSAMPSTDDVRTAF